ncbi:MAG: hypothetical protein II073_02480 [Lachnospiraceae bacterium]|nr:hypothetical protein [Lachnospiraceae bacterium]
MRNFFNVILSDKKKEEKPEESSADSEVTSEAPAEAPAETPAETPAEAPAEAPAETPAEAPAETPAETPAEAPAEAPTETPTEAPAEAPAETPAEAPAEAPAETPAETPAEAPADAPAPSKPPILVRIWKYFYNSKLFTDLLTFLFIFFLGICCFLFYGEHNKKEGIVSFETLSEQLHARTVCNYFAKNDMSAVFSCIYMPGNRTKKEDATFRTYATNMLQAEFNQLFPEETLSVKKVSSEYKKISKTDIHLISTCTFTISDTPTFTLTMERYKKGYYTFYITSNIENGDQRYDKLNALFNWIYTASESPADQKLICLLLKNNPQKEEKIGDFFYPDSDEVEQAKYSHEVALKFKSLHERGILITDAYLAPYSFNTNTSKKQTALCMRLQDTRTQNFFVYYQPLNVGLYGYEFMSTPMVYGQVEADVLQILQTIY